MLPNSAHVLTVPASVKPDMSTKPSEAVEAALLAVALYHGRLNAAQCCKLAGASLPYFAKANALNDREREQLATGELSFSDVNGKRANGHNGHANGKNGHSTECLVEHLRRASADELAEAGREIGVSVIFDAMICPFLDGNT
jgi:hypothetical protein